jgi:hypothetical protein
MNKIIIFDLDDTLEVYYCEHALELYKIKSSGFVNECYE